MIKGFNVDEKVVCWQIEPNKKVGLKYVMVEAFKKETEMDVVICDLTDKTTLCCWKVQGKTYKFWFMTETLKLSKKFHDYKDKIEIIKGL